MNTRDWARQYIGEGIAVVPIPKGEKGPTVPGWQSKTFTPDDFKPSDNIGALLGEPSKGLVDVDLDAPETLAAARELLLTTGRIHGRPGKPASHYWYICPDAKTRKFEDVDGTMLCELRSTGGQTVLPPSVHPSGETLAWELERAPSQHDYPTLLSAVRLVATTALLARHWPKGSRHEAAGAAAGFLAAHKIDPKIISLVILTAATIAKDEEARDRARYAEDTAKKAATEPTTGGTRLGELIGAETVKTLRRWYGARGDGAVDELNETYFVVRVGSDELIGHEDGEQVVFQSPHALRVRFANRKIVVGEKKGGAPQYKSMFDVWLESQRRRDFRQVTFAPPPLVGHERDYNLWRGFAVEADVQPRPEARCRLFLEHVHHIICAGNLALSEYVFDWMADCVQRPGKPGEVAIALRGKPGAGKGRFVDGFGMLFGRHYVQLDRTEHLTGKFNAQLSGKVLVFADEAIWAGSKHDLGPLKRLITERTLTIERKGIDVQSEPNCVHLITATNEGWSVPAMFRERRWCVLDVSDAVMQNRTYFRALEAEMANGGRAALLAWLLARRIERDVGEAPQTAALVEQTLRSASSVEQWWFEKLLAGVVFYDDPEPWPEFVGTPNAFDDYTAFCRGLQMRPLVPMAFRAELRPLLPPGCVSVKRRAARRTSEGWKGKDLMNGWRLMPLDVCRRHFVAFAGFEVAWPEGEAEQAELVEDL